MVDHRRQFAWYELMTTDIAAAKAFYTKVVGWEAQDASSARMLYALFTSGKTPVSGLIGLPEEAAKMGATSRWMGYVGVDDVDLSTQRLKHLGGAVYVLPTDSNIGRISVVADPQSATLGLVAGLKLRQRSTTEPTGPGHVGWHELLTTDCNVAFDFYAELFGWQKAEAATDPTTTYRLFSSGGEMVGGMFNKRPIDAVPFWLLYFNVGDLDAAAERVDTGGGQVFEGPLELPGGSWIARCRDPQGAAFALQGTRSGNNMTRRPASEVSWSTAWAGVSSRGRMVLANPRGRRPASDSEK